MLTLLLIALAQTPQHRLFMQPNLPRSSLPFFSAFDTNAIGTSGPCSTTAPTGARGETLTFTRASNGTCTKTATGGLATTGIANGDLVVLSSNVARVEYDSAGTLGLHVTAAASTNLLFQFLAIDTAVTWTDVGTPTLTTGQTSPFEGALATGAVQVDDNDGAAYEGRQQAVAVTAATAYYLSCYVKAGTRAEARITLDGTAATITGLSATTWSVVGVADASSSGASVVVELLSGDAVGDTGTVIFGGCQVELGTYRTSIIPTTTIAVARAAEAASFDRTYFSTATGASLAISVQSITTSPTLARYYATGNTSNRVQLDSTGLTNYIGRYNTAFAGPAPSAIGTTRASYAIQRVAVAWDGTSVATLYAPGAAATPATSAQAAWTGGQLDFFAVGDGIVSRVRSDPSPERCR